MIQTGYFIRIYLPNFYCRTPFHENIRQWSSSAVHGVNPGGNLGRETGLVGNADVEDVYSADLNRFAKVHVRLAEDVVRRATVVRTNVDQIYSDRTWLYDNN